MSNVYYIIVHGKNFIKQNQPSNRQLKFTSFINLKSLPQLTVLSPETIMNDWLTEQCSQDLQQWPRNGLAQCNAHCTVNTQFKQSSARRRFSHPQPWNAAFYDFLCWRWISSVCGCCSVNDQPSQQTRCKLGPLAICC